MAYWNSGLWKGKFNSFQEFYYGGGICSGAPAGTPYGRPVQSIPIGTTELPEDLFLEFLNDIAPRFAPEKYNLFTNNCNNFSHECALFLTGTGIPHHIVNLPQEVLATPMGKQLLQMMGAAGNNIMDPRTFEGAHNSQQMHLNYGPGIHELPPSNAIGSQNTNMGGNTGGNPAGAGGIQPVKELFSQQEYNKEIQANNAVVIDVFTEWCGPCQAIKPFFASLPNQFPQIRFFKVFLYNLRWIWTKIDSWEHQWAFNQSQHSSLFIRGK